VRAETHSPEVGGNVILRERAPVILSHAASGQYEEKRADSGGKMEAEKKRGLPVQAEYSTRFGLQIYRKVSWDVGAVGVWYGMEQPTL
jgi:hypothetical protein